MKGERNLRINSIGLGLVAVEADDGELGLNLTGINLNDTNPSCNQLLSQAVGEAADGSLGGTVDGASGVGLTAWFKLELGLFRVFGCREKKEER